MLGAACYLLDHQWVDFSILEKTSTARPSVVLDDHGNEIARFCLDKREPVTYEKIPQLVVEAFVAAEDRDFFNHVGISLKGIVRSMLVNLYHRRVVQGASTITQQLSKLLYLSYERTWLRKVREIFLALQVERQFTKEQIMQTYLNNIYFGRGIYGVEAASRRFWNKPVSEVTLDQAATLAAVAKSARFYSPLNAPRSAKRRRDTILTIMYNMKLITRDELSFALSRELEIEQLLPGSPMRLYVHEWIRQWAEAQWGRERLYRAGLTIKTSLNLSMQDAAEKAFNKVAEPLQDKLGQSVNGGMLSIDVHSGKIKAMVGGLDFKKSQYNRAMQAYRQIGSSFKPLLFSCALANGISMDTIYVDEPIEVEMEAGNIWRPRNWHHEFEGPMTLVRALTRSCNMITIKLLRDVGIQRMIGWAKKFGITKRLLPYPSLALGIAEATVEQNVAAFNVFANNGVHVKPSLIEWVKNYDGKKIWNAELEHERVLSVRHASQMCNVLSHRMQLARWQTKGDWIDAQTIGKSGSTNGATSVWFVGSTPSVTTAVYLGRDDSVPMGSDVFASQTALPIWIDFNRSVVHTEKQFYQDPSLQEVTIDWFTGQEVAKGSHPVRAVTILT